MSNTRMEQLNELIDEISKDDYSIEKVKVLTTNLGIAFSEDPMQLLNNVLKGIHAEGPKNESSV